MSDALGRLENALVLEERASFHLVICPARLELDDWLADLGTRLSERREEEVLLRRLDPYDRLDQADQALSEEDMVEAVLQPLLEPSSEWTRRGIIHILDASLTHPRDEACWRWLFRRLNELRNRIMGGLGDALLLAGSPRVELVFAAQAPDFWSIRTGEALLPTQARPPVPVGVSPTQLLLDTLGLCAWPMQEDQSLQLIHASDAIRHGDAVAARMIIEVLQPRLRQSQEGWSQNIASMLEIFLALENVLRLGDARRDELEQQAQKVRELPWGMTGSEMILAEQSAWFLLLLAEAAEYMGAFDWALDWHEEAFERFFSHWGGGVMSGSESWLIRACLGAFRMRAHHLELESAQEWLWAAEAFVARAPWWSSSVPEGVAPRPEDYRGIAASYALLGHNARARFYAHEAEESLSRAPPTEPAQTHDGDWPGGYISTLYKKLPSRVRESESS